LIALNITESAVVAEDWETKYREAWERFKQEKQRT